MTESDYWDNRNVLEDFDWDEAAELFKTMNWTWASVGPCSIPNASQLKNKAKHLIEECIRHSYTGLSTGRISVTIYDKIISINVGLDDSGSMKPFSDIIMDEALR